MSDCADLTQLSFGGHSERETPGSIPNPAVKPFSADGTASGSLWESRTSPDINVCRGHPCGWPLRNSAKRFPGNPQQCRAMEIKPGADDRASGGGVGGG